MTDEVSEIADSLAVFQPKGFPVVADGPILAVSGEDSFFLRGTGAQSWVTTGRATSSAPRLTCHLNFSRPLGLNFRGIATTQILPPAPILAHPRLCAEFSRLVR